MTHDIVIHNGIVITVNPDFDIIENGFIGILDGKIQQVGAIDGNKPHPAKTMIDANGGIILPGLVNTHTHLPMSLFRGLADDLPLTEWLNEYIFPAEQKHINPDSVKLGSLLGCAEMILSGTTTCCDGYFYEDAVAQAVLESGMRAVLGQGVIDFPAPGVPKPADNVNNAIRFVEKWKGISSRISVSIFCHSPYTCSKETLVKSKAASNHSNLLFQIHVAETQNELKQIQSEHHTTPVQFLEKMGVLDQKTLLVHAIWVNDRDISAIKKHGSTISVNTQSHMKLASGIAPVQQFLAAGIPVGLGTDGCASNNDSDLFGEMDSTAKLHKVNTLDPTAMNAPSVLKLATLNGARAIGLGENIGSIEIGKQADIIIVDTHKPHLVPMHHPVSHIVYAASGGDVRDVMVDGKILVKDYQLLTLNLADVMEEVAFLSQSIKTA